MSGEDRCRHLLCKPPSVAGAFSAGAEKRRITPKEKPYHEGTENRSGLRQTPTLLWRRESVCKLDLAARIVAAICYANRRALPGLSPQERRSAVLLQKKNRTTRVRFFFWSGLRGSNPPPPPWQGGALPNELNPRKWCLRSESNQRHEDFQSSALPTELQRHIGWRLGWGSNPRPLA